MNKGTLFTGMGEANETAGAAEAIDQLLHFVPDEERPATNWSRVFTWSVQETCKDIPTKELAAAMNFVTAGWDPTRESWYPGLAGLFTEDGGTELHSDIRNLFIDYVMRRIEAERAAAGLDDSTAMFAAIVANVCEKLALKDLLDAGTFIRDDLDPREQPWYPMLKPIITEAGETKMHSEYKRLFQACVTERSLSKGAAAEGGQAND